MLTKARGIAAGQLAQAAGVNLETVRYYETIGLMPAPARTEGGHRSYEPEHAQRLRFIRRSRELGFGIDAIRRLIALSEPGVQACCEVRDMAQDHIASVDATVAARWQQAVSAIGQQSIWEDRRGGADDNV